MTEAATTTITFNNLIEASTQGGSGLGNVVIASAAPFCASNAVGTILPMTRVQIASRAKAFAVRFKAGMSQSVKS